jgi:hypothetical protein
MYKETYIRCILNFMVCYFHEDWHTTNKKEVIFSQVSYSLTEIFSDLLRYFCRKYSQTWQYGDIYQALTCIKRYIFLVLSDLSCNFELKTFGITYNEHWYNAQIHIGNSMYTIDTYLAYIYKMKQRRYSQTCIKGSHDVFPIIVTSLDSTDSKHGIQRQVRRCRRRKNGTIAVG